MWIAYALAAAFEGVTLKLVLSLTSTNEFNPLGVTIPLFEVDITYVTAQPGGLFVMNNGSENSVLEYCIAVAIYAEMTESNLEL